MSFSLGRRLAAEGIGSFFLFAGVIGSGIMAEALSGGIVAVALLANTLATGAILFVLIAMLGPISGAHFNPAVSMVMAARQEITWGEAGFYLAAQFVGGLIGALAAHLMFDLPLWQYSLKPRSGVGQWAGEFVATFGLILTIIGTLRHRPALIPANVALTSSPLTGSPRRPASPIRRSRLCAVSPTASRALRPATFRCSSRRSWQGP